MTFGWPTNKRLPWVLGAILLMATSAFSVFRFFAIVTNISNWIGFPQFAAQIPILQEEARWWGRFGVVLPFVSALLLGLGKGKVVKPLAQLKDAGPMELSYSAERGQWSAPIGEYLLRLVISVVGTLAFVVLLLLVLFMFYKLGIHID